MIKSTAMEKGFSSGIDSCPKRHRNYGPQLRPGFSPHLPRHNPFGYQALKKYVYAILSMLIALALRLYPYLISGLPFSTDAWSPIRNAELLIEYTPIHLNTHVFDNNIYWPANGIFGVVVSEVTSLKPI